MRYVVLGMHKSGTTVLAQTLHASGIDMGTFDESLTYDQGNHCEREETKGLNKRLLACGNAHSLTVVQTVSLQDAPPTLLGEMAEAIHKLDEQHESWGFKDPRSCLTLDVWAELLSEFKVIGIYRHPLEVWHRYIHSRNPLTRLRRVTRGWRVLRAWHIYNTQLLACHDNPKAEFLLLEHSRFMQQNDSIERLGSFLGVEVLDVRKPELYRTHRETSLLYRIVLFLQATLFHRDVDRLYHELERLSDTRFTFGIAGLEDEGVERLLYRFRRSMALFISKSFRSK